TTAACAARRSTPCSADSTTSTATPTRAQEPALITDWNTDFRVQKRWEPLSEIVWRAAAGRQTAPTARQTHPLAFTPKNVRPQWYRRAAPGSSCAAPSTHAVAPSPTHESRDGTTTTDRCGPPRTN